MSALFCSFNSWCRLWYHRHILSKFPLRLINEYWEQLNIVSLAAFTTFRLLPFALSKSRNVVNGLADECSNAEYYTLATRIGT